MPFPGQGVFELKRPEPVVSLAEEEISTRSSPTCKTTDDLKAIYRGPNLSTATRAWKGAAQMR
jgi:hypothetical protein